jgi:hypothetical protein
LGFANAATLQSKTGIPAIVFGLVQTLALLGIYRAILKRERTGAEAPQGREDGACEAWSAADLPADTARGDVAQVMADQSA